MEAMVLRDGQRDAEPSLDRLPMRVRLPVPARQTGTETAARHGQVDHLGRPDECEDQTHSARFREGDKCGRSPIT
jgi:hypothetical protein